MILKIYGKVLSETPASGQVKVSIYVLTPSRGTKLISRELDQDGTFSTAIPTPKSRTLQAKLYDTETDTLLATSDIVTIENNRAEFILTLDPPAQKGSLYSRLDAAFKDIERPFPDDENERQLWYALVDDPKQAVRRYYNARALAHATGEAADGPVTDFYQDYAGSARKDKRLANTLHAYMAAGSALRTKPRFAEFIFGLLHGLPAVPDPTTLLAISRGEMNIRIKAAIDVQAIDPFSKDEVRTFEDGLTLIRSGLHMSYADGVHSSGPLLLLADLGIEAAPDVMDYLMDGKPLGSATQVPGELLRQAKPEGHARLLAVKALLNTVEQNATLAGRFLADGLGQKDGKPLRPGVGHKMDPSDVKDATAAMSAEDWAALFKDIGGPEAENARDIGEQIAANAMGYLPREMLLGQLKSSPSKEMAKVAEVLREHSDFDLREQAVDSYFADAKSIPDAERESLKTFARLQRLVPTGRDSIQHVATLAEAGVLSANAMLNMGKIGFLKEFEAKIPAHILRKTFCRARAISDMVGEVHVQMATTGYAIGTGFAQAAMGATGSSNPDDVAPPTLAEMFGSQDSCACETCQSVLSPAAYLHNLLHWMKSDIAGSFERLEEKRPDIPNLLLNCDNTHTVLPYIDLVNEALSWTLGSGTAAIETSWPQERLRLQPEHRFIGAGSAEERISQSNFPLALPYYRSAAEGRAALRSSGTSIAELMAIVLPSDRSSWNADQRKAYRAALLDMNPAVYDLLIEDGSEANFWPTRTGVDTAPGRNVGQIMASLGLSFEQTDALLRLHFITRSRSGGTAFQIEKVIFSDATCSYDTAKYELHPTSTEYDETVCSRALRLVRLSNETGLSTQQLDEIIGRFAALDPSAELEINAEFLGFLSAARELKDIASVNLDDLLSYLELPYPNGSIDRYDAFASMFTTRTGSDIASAQLFLRLSHFDLTHAEDLIAFLVLAKPLLDHATDLSALRPAPLSSFTGTRSDIRDASPNGLFVHLQTLVSNAPPATLAAAETAVLEGAAAYFDVPTSLCTSSYLDRGDSWAITFYQGIPVALSDVPGMADFALDVWRLGHQSWMSDMLVACDVDPIFSAQVHAQFGPASPTVPSDFLTLPLDLPQRLSIAAHLTETTSATAHEIAGVLFADQTPQNPVWLVAAQQALAQVPDYSALPVSDPDLLHKALYVQQAAKVTGLSEDTLLGLFQDPTTLAVQVDQIGWTRSVAVGEHTNLAAEIFFNAAQSAPNNKAKTFEAAADQIRIDLRDAMLAFLTHNPTLGNFDDLEDVYRTLLLDPSMQPCMMTSRLKAAISSVQLLMHRAMMNLEGGNIEVDEDDQAQWAWRKSYRIWEANTKILLYPENWIDPNLRTDPTPVFENASAMLMQDEVNEQTSEAVLYDYLSGLDKIARLDIRAMQQESDTLHVFGRTWVAPYEHYYRRREDGVWTHWEKIDIDIEADHIIPVFFHRRLWLFWPIFLDKQTKAKVAYKEIKLAYSTYEYGKWRGKKVLGDAVIAGPKAGRVAALDLAAKTGSSHSSVSIEPQDILFIADTSSNNSELRIMVRRGFAGNDDLYHNGYTELAFDDGWVIQGCNSDGELVPAGYATPKGWMDHVVARPYMTLPTGQNMTRGFDDGRRGSNDVGAGLYVKQNIGHMGHSVPILDRAPDNYNLTYPQERHALWSNPFFMMDKDRTHFFERSARCVATDSSATTGVATTHVKIQDDSYDVTLHEHPYACQMIATFNQYGVDGIFGRGDNPDNFKRQGLYNNTYFGPTSGSKYDPAPYGRINTPYPVLDFDFDHGTAYGAYNWELFFHLPMLIARQLKTEGRHNEAIRWLAVVYDPTSNDAAPRGVWRLKPFHDGDSRSNIAALVQLLGQAPSSAADRKLRKSFEAQLNAWRQSPFEPHKIAQHRHSAYMMWVALEYVDTLIDWGDALFRQDSIESINEATNLYMLADAILGKRPTQVEKGQASGAQSFTDLTAISASPATTSWLNDLESWMIAPTPEDDCKPQSCYGSVFGALSAGGYFCIPPNPRLPEYWDRVADRLFKIRHCRNLSGEQRSLALFQPPIDPALLVKARAAGLSIEDAIAGLTQTGLGYRFTFLLQKAQDFTAEVKSFGAQLLSALEKRDGEELALIRQTHERNLQKLTKTLKKMSLEEAKESLAALHHSRAGAQVSYDFYAGRELENTYEKNARKLSVAADVFMNAEQTAILVAGMLGKLPDLYAGISPLVHATGGEKLWQTGNSLALGAGILGSLARSQSGRASTKGSFQRRMDDWQNQAKVTAERLKELDRQIAAAEIRLQTAEKDLEVFDTQIEQAEDLYDFAKSKFTSEKLYGWMANTLKTLHRQAFELAANMARQAQMAANRELRASTNLSFISADQWDSSRAGLMAGERLSLQLKQLDNAYWTEKDSDKAYELTRTISLRRLDPAALYTLKSGVTTPVEFKLPEWLFQSDHDGTSLSEMRIQSVAVSLPCTTGPNAKVDLKLSLTSTDSTFPSQNNIITSTAQTDSGRFDPNPSAPTYLPFENANVADSIWTVTLPKRSEFDPITINDLVLTIRYTAVSSEGSQTGSTTQPPTGSFAVSLRHDFYESWLASVNKLQGSPHSAKELFPPADSASTDFMARVPYIYGDCDLDYDEASRWFILTRSQDGTTSIPENVFSTTPLELTDGRVMFKDAEVIDIIAVVKAS